MESICHTHSSSSYICTTYTMFLAILYLVPYVIHTDTVAQIVVLGFAKLRETLLLVQN